MSHEYEELVTQAAFDSMIGKKVDLVVYKNDERVVVGEAELVKGAGADIVVSARMDPVPLGILATPSDAFSIGEWARDVQARSGMDSPTAPDPQSFSGGVRDLLVQKGSAEVCGSDQDEGGHDPQ